MTTKKSHFVAKKITCEYCNYATSKNTDYKKHLLTAKHINATNYNKYNTLVAKEEKQYICECGKNYNHRASLFNHKKKCKYQELSTDNSNNVIQLLINENKDFKNLVLEVVKSNKELQHQNSELQKQVLDVCKTNNSNNTINSHNKTFNLQFFLNEQCKDAMNITDFINSVTLSLSDLENMGTSGYVNGISSIIIKELRGLDITKRPVHCSDAKRETLYIKDEDKWEKECPENTKMKTAIRTVEKKNIKLISEWTDKHPKFTNSTTKENDEYLQILIETMGGKGDYEKNKNKVIKNIAKEVVIDK